jgi:hypothetical protein
VNRPASLLLLLVAASHASIEPSALLGYRYEFGVESKAVAAVQADYQPVSFAILDAGLSFNLFQSNGLGAASIGIGGVVYRPAGLTLRLAAQHQQWNSWLAGENRLLATVEAGPLRGFDAGLGLVRRAPVFGDRYWSPLVWGGGAAEWNYLYRLRWKFIQRENWWLRTGFSSYDRFTAHSPQQFPVEVEGAYRPKDDLELFARAGTAIVGYSGGLPSFHELEVCAGVTYEF